MHEASDSLGFLLQSGPVDGGGIAGVIGGFAQAGVLGLMLWWFAIRNEKLTQRLTEATNRNTRALALILQVVTMLPHASMTPDMRDKARQMLEDVTKDDA